MTFSSDNPLRFRNDLEQNNDIKKKQTEAINKKEDKRNKIETK